MKRSVITSATLLFTLSLLLVACFRQNTPPGSAPTPERVRYPLDTVLETQGTASGNGLTLTFDKTADWDAGNGDRGFTANLTLRNETGSTLEDWDLSFSFLHEITSMWSAGYVQDGSDVLVTPASWNATLADGQTRNFGFQGIYSEVFQEPTAYVVSGIPVGEQVPPEPVTPACVLDTTFTVTSEWDAGGGARGFVAEMQLTNAGADPVNWEITFDLDATITSMWNASFVAEGNGYRVTPASWNVRIEPGQSRSFGFLGTFEGAAGSLTEPQNVVCNGQDNEEPPTDSDAFATFEVSAPAALDALAFRRDAGTSVVTLAATNVAWNAASTVLSADVTLTNTSSDRTFQGVRAVLTDPQPQTVASTNPDGYTADDAPFLEFGTLEPGQSVARTWRLHAPGSGAFTLRADLLESDLVFDLTSASPASFSNDTSTSVTLEGRGIRAETAFFIQSTRLSVTSWSDTSATVTVPEGFAPASYGVMAINPDGSRATLYPALTITAGATPPPLEPTAIPRSFVDGFVIDYATREPVAGARVSVPGLATTTSATGYFLLRGVPEGRQAVRIEADGYEPVYRFAEVLGEQQTVTVRHAALERKDPNVSMIGPEGGRHDAGGGAFLMVPEGALSETVPIQFTHTRAASTIPELPEDGYYLAFARLGPSGLTFAKPATLFLPLQEGIVVPEGTPIRISYFDEREKRWVQDVTSGVIAEVDGRLYLEYEINHFTWIGGQWFPDSVEGCVRYADGSPAVGALTNYGSADESGQVQGTTTRSQVGRDLRFEVFGVPGAPTVTRFYNGGGDVNFGCIELPVANPQLDPPGTQSGGGDNCGSGGYGYLRESRELRIPGFASQVAAPRGRPVLTQNVYAYTATIAGFASQGIDISTVRLTVGGVDVTGDAVLVYPQRAYVDGQRIFRDTLEIVRYIESGDSDISGAGVEIALSATTRSGETISSTSTVDIVERFSVPQVVPLVVPDKEADPAVTYPRYTDYQIGDAPVLLVEILQSDVVGGAAQVSVPVRALGGAGSVLDYDSPDGVRFSLRPSDDAGFTIVGDAVMIEGVARVPVSLDLDGIPYPGAPLFKGVEVDSSGTSGSDSSLLAPSRNSLNAQEGPDCYPVDDPRIDEGRWRRFWRWFGDLSPSDIKTALQIGVGLVPFVGDGIDLIYQLYDTYLGAGGDPFLAVMSGTGLIIDTLGGGLADVTGILKGIYRASGGLWRQTMSNALFDFMFGGPARSPQEIAQFMQDSFGGAIRLFGSCGPGCVRQSENLGQRMVDDLGRSPEEAMRGIQGAIDGYEGNPRDLLDSFADADADDLNDTIRILSCSFSSDTLVATPGGFTPIASISVGDLVLGFNETSQIQGTFTVAATWSHLDPTVVELVIDGERIETTVEHPFHVDGRWVAAGDLLAGMEVTGLDERTGVVESVTIFDRPEEMFNLTVAKAHTFFVGSGGWLVHNACSSKLDRDLGGVTGDGKQAHHLIPGQREDHPLVQRAVDNGWDIDSANNGVLLPSEDFPNPSFPRHRGSHGAYNDYMEERLDHLRDLADQGSWTDDQVQEALEALSNEMRNRLRILAQGEPGTPGSWPKPSTEPVRVPGKPDEVPDNWRDRSRWDFDPTP